VPSKNLFRKLRSLFERSEYFLILTITLESIHVVALRVNFEKKKIRIVKEALRQIQNRGEETIQTALAASLKTIPKRFREGRVVLSLHPTLATTIHSTVELTRDTPQEPIDNTDLDQRIAQAIWRLFDGERSRAAVKMGISDLEVALSDVGVRRVRLDGHTVLNPLGFKATTMAIELRQTFCAKSLMEHVRKLFPKSRSLFMIESGMAVVELVAHVEKQSPFLFVQVGISETSFYTADRSEMVYRDAIGWGEKEFFSALGETFAVDPVTARAILQKYLRGEASPKMRVTLEKIFFSELHTLGKGIGVHLGAMKKVYLYAPFALPPFIFSPRFAWHIASRPKILPAGDALITETLGFTVEGKTSTSDFFIPPVALLAFYFSSGDATMDSIAKRHARWLIN